MEILMPSSPHGPVANHVLLRGVRGVCLPLRSRTDPHATVHRVAFLWARVAMIGCNCVGE
eukprot:scaffold323812_cov36-Tisochrysis_lutea.AAC.1